MKERPILFNGEMIRAILDGRKTQTRRVVKHIPALGRADDWCLKAGEGEFARMVGNYRRFCPYGAPGDALWVRETWAEAPNSEDGGDGMTGYPIHRADYDPEDVQPLRWRPSIHMPRWACRLTLRVTGVRVERVQDISEEGATAEGIDMPRCDCTEWACENCMGTGWGARPTEIFAGLWDSINAKRGYGWDANPWVWVVEFERIESNQDAAQ